MSELLIPDWDRTLFRPDDFASALIMSTAERFGLDDDVVNDMVRTIVESDDTVSMSELYGRQGIEFGDVIAQCGSVAGSYLYNDAEPLLARHENYWIVTTATNAGLQTAKLAHEGQADCATIVPGTKGPYIRDRISHTDDGRLIFADFSETQSFESIKVVDDRFEAIRCLLDVAGVKVVYLRRPDSKYKTADSDIPEGVTVVTSLDEIK